MPKILVNGGCSSSISKVQLSSNVFVKHDDAACRKIAQGGFTIETSSKNSPARLGNKVSLLRQRYERRAKTVSFVSMNKQSRDIWVNHIIQVLSSNSGIEEPQDLLTGSPRALSRVLAAAMRRVDYPLQIGCRWVKIRPR